MANAIKPQEQKSGTGASTVTSEAQQAAAAPKFGQDFAIAQPPKKAITLPKKSTTVAELTTVAPIAFEKPPAQLIQPIAPAATFAGPGGQQFKTQAEANAAFRKSGEAQARAAEKSQAENQRAREADVEKKSARGKAEFEASQKASEKEREVRAETPIEVLTKVGQEETQIIEDEILELEAIPIEAENKTALQINEEITAKERDVLTRRLNLNNMVQRDRYRASLKQNGFLGTGTGNALEMSLLIGQSLQNTSAFEDISLRSMQNALNIQLNEESREFQRDSLEQQSFDNLFQSLSGSPEDQLLLAQQLAEAFPDNKFYQEVATNPVIQESLRNANNPAVRARRNELTTQANNVVFNIGDFDDERRVRLAKDDFKEITLSKFSDDEAALKAISWLDDSLTTIDEVNRLLGTDFQSKEDAALRNPDIVKDAWIESEFENTVKDARTLKLIEDMQDSVISQTKFSDEDLEVVNNSFALLANPDNGNIIRLAGLTEEVNNGSPNGTVFEFMFTDWDGIDYDPTNNPYSERPQSFKSLDKLWTAYAQQLQPGESSVSREEFRKQFGDASEDGVDVKPGTSAQKSVQAFVEAQRIRTAETAPAVLGEREASTLESLALNQPLNEEIARTLLSGNREDAMDVLRTSDKLAIKQILDSPQGDEIVNSLISSGAAQSFRGEDGLNKALKNTQGGVEEPFSPSRALTGGSPEFVVIDDPQLGLRLFQIVPNIREGEVTFPVKKGDRFVGKKGQGKAITGFQVNPLGSDERFDVNFNEKGFSNEQITKFQLELREKGLPAGQIPLEQFKPAKIKERPFDVRTDFTSPTGRAIQVG